MGYDFIIERGATSVILHVYLTHATTGDGLTGLTNASAGLVITAIRPGEASAAVYAQASSNIETITTIGTYAAPSASKIRFKEIDATNMPGWYEVHLADALLNVTNTRRSLALSFFGATNLRQANLVIQLIGNTLQDPNGVKVGTNNDKSGYFLANDAITPSVIQDNAVTAAKIASGAIAAAAFASNAITASAIAADAIGASEFAQAAADKVWATATRQLTGTQTFSLTGSITGNLSGSVGSVSGNVGGSVASIASGGIAAASFAAGAITSSAFASNAITAAAIAADAIGASEFAQAAADKVWASATRSLTAAVTLTSGGVDAIWDEVVEAGFTARQLARGWSAALFGSRSGGGTSTLICLGLDGSTNRITLEQDADGNSLSEPLLDLT